MNHCFKRYLVAFSALVILVLLVAGPDISFAQAAAAGADPNCTDFATLVQAPTPDATGKLPTGILTNLTNYIKDIVKTASQDLFNAFVTNSAYGNAVNAATILMVVLFGVGFTIGIVQATFGQILVRLMKIGLVYSVVSPGGWSFFYTYVVHFFNDGTDQLIALVMNIGAGSAIAPGDAPFLGLDHIAAVILSPDMVIAILGSAIASGPYGFGMAALLAWAAWGLVRMLIDALKTYAIAYVIRALLLGVAPIFFVFLLFDRTKQLFMGWVNTMVVLSLRPILYFTFISFFLIMLTSSTQNMMGGAELCWTEFANQEGSQNKTAFWRFKAKGESFPKPEKTDWYGSLSCQLNGGTDPATGKPCAPFPINIVDLLSFLILIYVAGKFGAVVTDIANEISNSYANLDVGIRRDFGAGSATGTTAEGAQTRGITQPSGAKPSAAPVTTRDKK